MLNTPVIFYAQTIQRARDFHSHLMLWIYVYTCICLRCAQIKKQWHIYVEKDEVEENENNEYIERSWKIKLL